MVKRVIYKGTPLASASIVVAADATNVTVHADPSMGKRVYMDRIKDGLTREEASELVQRLIQATSIMDELAIEDDGLENLQDRLAELRETLPTSAEDRLQERFDELVHDVASQQGSDINNRGLDGQLEFLVGQLGSKEVERIMDQVIEEQTDE